MADRTIDIVRLRQAARLCRAKVAANGAGTEDYVRLAAEIDGLIRTLSAESTMRRSAGRAAAI